MDESRSYEYEIYSSHFNSTRRDSSPPVGSRRPEDTSYPKKSCATLLLEERLDIDFGLLDKLLSNGVLSGIEYADVKTSQPAPSKSEKLLTYISEKKKSREFDRALVETNQQHLLNYFQSSGKHNDSHGGDWPLTERQMMTLNVHQEVLVELMELSSALVDELYSIDVLNKRHKEFICDHSSDLKKSEMFLDILRRRSFRDYKETIKCFRASNQKHIADILEGGVVGRMTCCLVTYNPCAETRSITRKIVEKISGKLAMLSFNDSDSNLELNNIGLIDVRFDNGIVFYFHFKKVEDLLHLKKMYDACELKTIVETDFKKLHSTDDFTVILQWSVDDFSKCNTYIRSRPSLERPTCVSDFPMEVLEIILSKAYALYFYLVNPHPRDKELFKSLSSVTQFWHITVARRRFKTSVNRCLSPYFHLITKRKTIIRNNRHYLVENMDSSDLLINGLRETGCLTRDQAEFVSRLRHNSEKNHELLNIARSLCFKQHSAFIDCLHFCRQLNVANVMEKGGVVVKTRVTHAKVSNIEELKERLSEKIRQMRTEDTQQFQTAFIIMSEIDIIEDPYWRTRKSSEGIVMLLWCKSEESFRKLKKLADSGSLLELICNIINWLLSNDQASVFRKLWYKKKPLNDFIKAKTLIFDPKQFFKRIAVRKMSLERVGQINVSYPEALTSLDDKIYVLSERLITVHEDNLPFTRKKTIPIDSRDSPPVSYGTMKPFMESCDKTNCIYFSCSGDSCIRKLTRSEHDPKVAIWKSDINEEFSLSVNSNGNVLLLKIRRYQNTKNFLELYTKDAVLLHQIQLPNEKNLSPDSVLEISPGVLAINYRNRKLLIQRLLSSETIDPNYGIQYPKTTCEYFVTVLSYSVNRLLALTSDTLKVLDLQLNGDTIDTKRSSTRIFYDFINPHYRKDKRQLMVLGRIVEVYTLQYNREDIVL